MPYLVADTRLAARPISGRWLMRSAGPGDQGGLTDEAFEPVLRCNVELLLEWLRSRSFIQTLDLVCGGHRDAFRSCVTPGATFDELRSQVASRFHFARVDETAGKRWIAGFGDTVDEVVRRLSFATVAFGSQSWEAYRGTP